MMPINGWPRPGCARVAPDVRNSGWGSTRVASEVRNGCNWRSTGGPFRSGIATSCGAAFGQLECVAALPPGVRVLLQERLHGGVRAGGLPAPGEVQTHAGGVHL